jgi:glycosyltransferase involved in cell wall biosynthesis
LRQCLQSFVAQTLPADEFEIVLVDDGSTDETEAVCREFAERLPLMYLRQEHAGRGAAKNLGIWAARSPLLLIFDDDDVAAPDLLNQHLHSHGEHPEPNVAILGYTTWATHLPISPVMEFITDGDQILFSYPKLQQGQVLDWKYFWEGRISCKRGFLIDHGLHDETLQYTIDIELGYRLAQAGLQVIFNRQAVSYMARSVTFDDFCRRCEDKGKSQYRISRIHPDAVMRQYCQVEQARQGWQDMQPAFAQNVDRVRELEAQLEALPRSGRERDAELDELWRLYRWTFRACTLKGIAEAEQAVEPAERSKITKTGRQARQPGGSKPLLSVVFPVWNTTDELAGMSARDLDRVWQVAQVELEVILIENGSTVRLPYRTSRSIEFDENRGVSVAWNAGAAAAQGEVICFLNSDVWVEPGWDAALCQASLDGRRIAFAYTDHDDERGPRPADTAGLAGWCFALSRTTWDEIGQFDESFSPAFFEETDYFHRAWQLGIELTPVPKAVVRHARRTTAKHQPRMEWLFQAHRLKYGWKHGVDPKAPPPFYLRQVIEYAPPKGAEL